VLEIDDGHQSPKLRLSWFERGVPLAKGNFK